MALASAHQQPSAQLTPPSSSHGWGGSWDFAVPLNDLKSSYQKLSVSDEDTSAHPRSPRNPLVAQPNGVYAFSGADMLDSQQHHSEEEQAYLAPSLAPSQGDDLQRERSNLTANGSDPDSYKADVSSGKRNAPNAALNKGKKKKKVTGVDLDQVEKDKSYWIHRDKLKEIETRELEEAGFKVGHSSRSNSRSQSASRRGRDRNNSETTDHSQPGDDRPDHRPFVSPIPAEDEEFDDGGQTHWDLRTPEEIAAENEAWLAQRNTHSLRPSTSRIPIAKTSPAPVPNTFVERDAPLARSRNGSFKWSGDSIAANGARIRSGSISSQNMLDEPHLQTNFSNPTSPTRGSPQKAKAPGKPTPTGRKTSAQKPNTQSKSRTVSGPSPPKRPGTSGGSVPRPTTSHRPPGEAPWIATMYKPDPRLPPDQQIIPTHAKRLQQEQWETQGKPGSVYGRDFRQLNTDEFEDKRMSQTQPLDFENPQDNQQWPLSPTLATKPSPERMDNLRSPTNEGGSYKLTPTIQQSSRVPSRAEARLAPAISPAKPKPVNTTRQPEPPVVEEKEKNGRCCIVM